MVCGETSEHRDEMLERDKGRVPPRPSRMTLPFPLLDRGREMSRSFRRGRLAFSAAPEGLTIQLEE